MCRWDKNPKLVPKLSHTFSCFLKRLIKSYKLCCCCEYGKITNIENYHLFKPELCNPLTRILYKSHLLFCHWLSSLIPHFHRRHHHRHQLGQSVHAKLLLGLRLSFFALQYRQVSPSRSHGVTNKPRAARVGDRFMLFHL